MSVVVVTGANRGIGFGVTRAIAEHDSTAVIVLGCRSLKAADDAIVGLKKLNLTNKFCSVEIDIDDNASIAAAVERIGQQFGLVDGA